MGDIEEVLYSVKQTRDKETGSLLREVFYNAQGLIDRGGLASVIHYHPKSGAVIEEFYHKDGVLHRGEGKPAYVKRHRLLGHAIKSAFYTHGVKTDELTFE